jgi:hypothetical protein
MAPPKQNFHTQTEKKSIFNTTVMSSAVISLEFTGVNPAFQAAKKEIRNHDFKAKNQGNVSIRSGVL